VLISIRLDALDSAPLALSVAGEPLIEPPTPAR